MSRAFFHLEAERWFVGNDAARGPWDENACHAGPVTGIIARALEQEVVDKQLLRLNVEILKPVPMSGFEVKVELRKEGRMITALNAQVLDLSANLIALANSLHATLIEAGELPSAPTDVPVFEDSLPGDFPIKEAQHDRPFFSSGIEVRYPPGESSNPGPTTVWMRTIPLLESEAPSPFQRLCPLADCGNGISRNQEVSDANFLNPDLSIVMFRAPESEWLASQARSFWEPTGLGATDATLFDTRGPIACASQSLLVAPVE